MIINGDSLAKIVPLRPFVAEKVKENGVSYGLGEAGYDVRIKQSVLLHPFQRFKIASTFEYFTMPTNMIAVVHDKSTWARKGISVQNTVLEPGWKGWLTLELVYYGWKPILIKAGSGIAQVLFHEASDHRQYDGKYQHQPNHPVPAVFTDK
jgi:dCTP deaminase